MDIQEQMKARLVEYCAFLNELSTKEAVREADAEMLQRLATFLYPIEAEVENEDAAGLDRWSVRDWARRPRQTGMEQQNEKVVLELINLFSSLDIPFYIRDKRGEKTGREYSTPERLEMLKQKYFEMITQVRRADQRVNDADQRVLSATKLVATYEIALRAAIDELRENENTEQAATRAKIILENVNLAPSESVKVGEPNDRGVRRVTLDAREVLLRLCMQRIVHDLAPDERICKQCLGLGIFKATAPFGLGDRKPGESAFPFFHQWLSECHHCYMGKVRVCPQCNEDLPRSRTRCECKAAQAERMAEEAVKEEKRREGLKRIALADYTHPMVWCDATDEFIQVDYLEEHLEEHPDAVIFACEPSEPLTWIDAADYIETLQNRATEEATPEDGDEVLDFSKEAEPELEAYLKEWAKKHVIPRDLYYPNMNLIVEVSRGDAADAVPAVRVDDGAGKDGAPAGAEDLRGGAPPGDDAPA